MPILFSESVKENLLESEYSKCRSDQELSLLRQMKITAQDDWGKYAVTLSADLIIRIDRSEPEYDYPTSQVQTRGTSTGNREALVKQGARVLEVLMTGMLIEGFIQNLVAAINNRNYADFIRDRGIKPIATVLMQLAAGRTPSYELPGLKELVAQNPKAVIEAFRGSTP